tara:strand:+ start:47 stop:532 length:486 start_codon:yes stop_codon:yes gene_type:complete
MFRINNNLTYKLLLIFSILVLLSASFIQYVLGHKPCNLCLIERVPYFLAIVLILFFLFFKKYEKLINSLILILFLFGFFVSLYHIGIEQGYFKESFVCNLEFSSNKITAQDLLRELEEKTISCKVVTFRVFGFSLATFNAVISLSISVIMIMILKNYEKNK